MPETRRACFICFSGLPQIGAGISADASLDWIQNIQSKIKIGEQAKKTQLLIGTLLACSFNIPMMEELYQMEGRELVGNEIDTLLGPGINIHRYPLNGRNFEYFSEDPLVTGQFAAAMTRGIRSAGSSATVKHFAANNQETERHNVNSVVSCTIQI